MTKKIPFLVAFFCCVLSSLQAEEPLRVFIRAGNKTHGPGAHDFPRFLEQWRALLEQRGAVCDGGLEFPTQNQLDKTDVLVLHAEEAGNIKGEERNHLEAFLKRGGGLVAVHAGAVSRDPDWYKGIIGGSWRFGTTKWLEAPMSLYFTDRENPITRDLSNFDIDDEIYYDMELLPEVRVLAAAYTPKAIDTGGHGNQEAQARAAEAVAKKKGVNIYDVQPQVWTYENTIEGGAAPYRALVSIPGHWQRNFSHNGIRTLLLRGIAWAGKRQNIDEYCKPEELGDALRYVEGGAPRPGDLSKDLEVHPDFELSLVAAEPLVNNPMNINWDEQGRLWVCETPEYPNGLRQANVSVWKDSGSAKPGNYERDPLDRISILSDRDGDGVMDGKKVFADKLELVTSFVFHRQGVIACAAPDIWLLEDTDGDEVADKRTKLYTQLGTRDTHAVINNMRWGQDGWVYATHGYSASDNVTSGDGGKSFGPIGSGVVRFKPDGSAFEQYASKGGNTWGLEITRDGEVFYTQPTTGNPLVHVVLPEYILAKGKVPGTSGTLGLLPGAEVSPAMQWEQQAYVQIDQVGRYTAGAGCVIYEGGAWPEKWNHSYFTTEPTVNLVGHFFVEKDGSTYKAAKEKGRENTEFIRSRNLWFRPIEVRSGPDGALYIVDFCNQAVIHNDTRGPAHGPANAAVRPDRDHYYGRIWRVQHKQARSLPPLKLDPKNQAALREAAGSANKHTRETAQRLLRENHGATPGLVGSNAVRAYARAVEGKNPAAVVEQAKVAGDDWILSALIAASSESPQRAVATVEAALASGANDRLATLVAALMPVVARGDTAAHAVRLLAAGAKADPDAMPVVAAVLRGLVDEGASPPPFGEQLQKNLQVFLERPATSALVLPLIEKWDRNGEMKVEAASVAQQLIVKLNTPSLKDEERLAIAGSLVSLSRTLDQVRPALEQALTGANSENFKRDLLLLVGGSDDPKMGVLLAANIGDLSPALQAVAFDQVVKRTERSQQLLDLIEKGEITVADLGPANAARLRHHPNKKLARRANLLLDRLSPAAQAKNELIAKLAPEVEKPGDPARGQVLFSACIVCHKMGGAGIEVGPGLDGMGAHGPGELLVHILDPNREVDPSFWAYNITTKKGEAYMGVVTSENASSITLATQAGVKEIAKAEVARRENTKRSLMPEGFEALGAEGLRDLLAYICGDAARRFRILDLSKAYTADSRAGIFANSGPGGGVLQLPKTGNIMVGGVPFWVQAPAKSRSGVNLVVLKGGPDKDNFSKTFPQSVEIEVNLKAKKLHLLSGIGGWAYPAGGDGEFPVMKAEVVYQDGGRESLVMKNALEFADYIRPIEVPGSAFVEELSERTQIRWITFELTKSDVIQKLVLSSFDTHVAPVVVAVTADIEGVASAPVGKKPGQETTARKGAGKKRSGPPPAIPATPVAWEKGKTKVVLIGGGTSHAFQKFFGEADKVFLEAAGFTVHYTEDRDQATRLLGEADVAVISVNRKGIAAAAYRKALMDRIGAGKGVVMLHPGVWYGYPEWPELNAKIIGGGALGHDKLGAFQVEVVAKDHPVMRGVAENFALVDELYHVNAEGVPGGTLPIEVLAKTSPSEKFGKAHPSIWVVENPQARIVGIAPGHDERTHGHPAFQRILTNAVRWVGEKN